MNPFREILKKLRQTFGRSQGVTVRYMFPVLLGFAAVAGLAAVSSSDVSYIRLEVNKNTVEAGDAFAVDVYAYAHVPVNAVDVTLRFNKNDVDVIGVDRGQSVLTIWTEDPIIEDDRVILRGGTFRRGFIGEHKIATIELRAVETGPSEFKASDVVLLAGDGRGTSVQVGESQGTKASLYIYDENTDPGDIAVNVEINVLTDIDGDGNVTLRDISAFMAAWASRDKVFDFNNDGRMTFRDFSIILASWFLQ